MYCAALYKARVCMEKSAFTREHRIFVELLKASRQRSGLTQVQLAEKLGLTQSYISKWEHGELRLDMIQLRKYCRALGIGLVEFVTEFESRLGGRK